MLLSCAISDAGGHLCLSMIVCALQLVPTPWLTTLPVEQQEWVGNAVFRYDLRQKKGVVKEERLWWYPPGPRVTYLQPPASPNPWLQCRFFLWRPLR